MQYWVYDFEILYDDWTVTFKNLETNKYVVIYNNVKALDDFTNYHQGDIFIGYNNSKYDQYVWDAILTGVDPVAVSKKIIIDRVDGWKFYRDFKYELVQYDVLKALLMKPSLKTVEGNLGLEIKESEIDLLIERKLTEAELNEILDYNKKDVDATAEVFAQTISTFESKLNLLKMFGLPLKYIVKTDAQLTAIILKSHRKPLWKNKINGVLDKDYYEAPKNLRLGKYQYLLDVFGNYVPDDFKKYKTIIANIDHTLGLGGIHGDTKKRFYQGLIINLDVASYYPNLMIIYDYLSRNVMNPELFKEIVDLRINHKNNGDLAMSNALKLVINTTFGASKSQFNELFDVRMGKAICITGQLFLVDLIDKVEPYITELIQSNTDGIMFVLDPNQYELVKIAVEEWEQRTGLTLEWIYGSRMWQKDVNNYIFEDKDGHLKYKGGYVTDGDIQKNSGIIINEAIKEYFVHGIKPEDYITRADHNLIKYQFIAKGGKNFSNFYHKIGNDFIETKKVNRVIATNYEHYGTLYKRKADKETYEKIASLPEHCLVINDDIRDFTVVDFKDVINFKFYIDATYKKINEFIK